jgi:tRNA 5-methylaminomethyl-2-thiouridine biosynthesis bifunctional protein
MAGIVMPRFGFELNADFQFYSSSFLYAVNCLNFLKQQYGLSSWQQSGVLQLISEQKVEKIKELDLPKQFLHYLNHEQASDKAGISLSSGALYYPLAGYVNPSLLCAVLSESCAQYVRTEIKTNVHSIKKSGGLWQLYDETNTLITESENIIFANGFDAQRLLSFDHLKLSESRGQLSQIPVQETTKNLTLPLCADGYIIPQIGNTHVIGATYSLENKARKLLLQDHQENLLNANKMLKIGAQIKIEKLIGKADSEVNGEIAMDKALSGRVSFRTTSLDHMPLVGPLPDENAYLIDYKNIHYGRKLESYPSAKYLPGLYVSTGHGSRGLVSCFSSATYLTSLITGEPVTLANNVIQHLHPARFLIRAMKKSR